MNDLDVALQHRAAQLGVGIAGLDLERGLGLALEIADLLRLRVRPRGDDAVVHDVPERHQMRAAIGADGGACHDAFLAEEARELGLRHLDLGPSRHDYKLISWATFSRWCVASPNVNSDDLARLK